MPKKLLFILSLIALGILIAIISYKLEERDYGNQNKEMNDYWGPRDTQYTQGKD